MTALEIAADLRAEAKKYLDLARILEGKNVNPKIKKVKVKK